MNFTVGQGTDLALSKLFSSQGLLALHAETKAMCFQSWNIQNYFSLIDRATSERQFRLTFTDLVLLETAWPGSSVETSWQVSASERGSCPVVGVSNNPTNMATFTVGT